MGTCRFRVLGPVEVEIDGVPVAGLPPRHRALVAALVVDAGRVVPVDLLVDRVWDGRPPGDQSGTVQAVVSKLRRALEPAGRQVLVTRAPGYLLAVEPDDVDALRFPALLRRARELADGPDLAAARAAVQEALALWRGPAYADVPAEFAAAEAGRLEELRLSALELAAELDLRAGRHAELVESLPALVRAQPLREGLRGALMLALYRCGRQAEALQLYAETRELLADELGVDPGREVQRLYEQVLRQDPALDLPAAERAPAPPEAGEPAVLPAPLTAFLGRREELAALDRLLAGRRLVTLTGPGGSGKTRLALEAARARATTGAPVAMVELAGVSDPELVPEQVAEALGVSLAGGAGLDAVARAVRGRGVLLVVDNAEHLLDAVSTGCARLLAGAADLVVLATSREPLGVPGEAVLPVGPLPQADAVQLFLDRARAAAPAAAPGEADLGLVDRVCTDLDGLPLAVELAAACLSTLPLREVADGVQDRFTLLAGGFRTAPPHQRTLADTVRWSVDLLSPLEREVFLALSTFSGSFAPDAVEAVLGGDRPAVPALRALVAKSLVELDHGTGRYRLLQTLRQYGAATLPEQTRDVLATRHAEFLRDLVARVEPTLRRRDGAAGWVRLDAEQPDLRAAMAHALTSGQAATALQIASGLGWWWYRRGHVLEGQRWLSLTLPAADEVGPEVVARAQFARGLLGYLQGDIATVWASTEEVVRVAPGADDGVLAIALVLRGFVRSLTGQEEVPGQAAADTARGIEVAQTCGVDWVRAEVAMTMGQFARAQGDLEGALVHLADAADLAEEVGHAWAVLSTQWLRAKVLVDLGDGTGALRTLVHQLQATTSEQDSTGFLASLLVAVGAAATAGQARGAAVLLGALGELSRRTGYDPLRMDQLDGERYVAATRAGLPPDRLEAALEEGRGLDAGGVVALLAELAGAGPVLDLTGPPAVRSGAAAG